MTRDETGRSLPDYSRAVPWPRARDETQMVHESKRREMIEGSDMALRDKIDDDIKRYPDLPLKDREGRHKGIRELHDKELSERLDKFDRDHEQLMQRMQQRHDVRER
jgi:hypothetical protein